MSSVRIVYLDQNKWIELARAAKRPTEFPEVHALLGQLHADVHDGRTVCPLSFANIYETFKIYNPERRSDLATIQAALSCGIVFRGRHARLEFELSTLLRDVGGIPSEPAKSDWFLSDLFFEAIAERGDSRMGLQMSDTLIAMIRSSPELALCHYFSSASDDERALGVRRFSESSDELRQKLENRRNRTKGESFSMRRKIYSAILLIDEIEFVLEIARRVGLPWHTVSDMGAKTVRRIVDEVPIYHIERELALRVEAQDTRPLDENDFRDMQAFCAVVPYADDVIAEKQFVNLARQARLDQRYDARLATDLLTLRAS